MFKRRKKKVIPSIGDKKVVKKFFFCKKLGIDVRLLQFALIEYVYKEIASVKKPNKVSRKWIPTRFVDSLLYSLFLCYFLL